MKEGPKISSIEVYEFPREVRDMGNSAGKMNYEPGTVFTRPALGLKINTDAGVTGEYVTSYAIQAGSLPQALGSLIGENALEREKIYDELKHLFRQNYRLGLAAIDIALWDLAGKYYKAPIYELLGGYRRRLPVYLSTTSGDKFGALNTPEAYADYAEQALEQGYRAYKIHPFRLGGDKAEDYVAIINAVGRRVGGKMDLMWDGSVETFADTLKVGRACDEWKFFWLEDSLPDGGVSHFGYKKVRQFIKTPLLQGEYSYGLEQRLELLLHDATDYARGDVPHDGITATMKLAHACEALGVDVELHLGGPETMQCMAAMRNSNYFEWGMLNPKIKRAPNQMYLYLSGYEDVSFAGVGKDGCVPVPEGPGLGVEYDWEFIKSRQTAYKQYK